MRESSSGLSFLHFKYCLGENSFTQGPSIILYIVLNYVFEPTYTSASCCSNIWILACASTSSFPRILLLLIFFRGTCTFCNSEHYLLVLLLRIAIFPHFVSFRYELLCIPYFVLIIILVRICNLRYRTS
jgi:hypothetical protein